MTEVKKIVELTDEDLEKVRGVELTQLSENECDNKNCNSFNLRTEYAISVYGKYCYKFI